MKNKLLPLLLAQAALILGQCPAFGQSVWDDILSLPISLPSAAPYGNVVTFTSPQANVGWGTYQRYPVNGFTDNPYVFSTADNWQTASTGGPQFTVNPSNVNQTNTLIDLTAVDGQTAWVLGTSAVAGGTTPVLTLWRTTSGVQGFTTLPTPLPVTAKRIHFFTATTGVAVCDAPAGTTAWPVYRTTDAGSTWTIVANTPAITASARINLSVKRNIGNSLWLKTSEGAMLHTADAGLTWVETPNISVVAFEDALHGIGTQGVGTAQLLLRTADGGTSWTSVGASGLPVIESIAAIPGSPGTYITIGSVTSGLTVTATTAITRNQGTSWQVLSTDHSYFYEIFASSPNQIWIRGGGSLNPNNSPYRLLSRFTGNLLGTRQPLDPALQAIAYPNPTNGLLQLTGPLQGEETVRVYDAAGRLCQTGQVSEARRTVDLSAQHSGLYQVLLTAANGSVRSLKVSKTE